MPPGIGVTSATRLGCQGLDVDTGQPRL